VNITRWLAANLALGLLLGLPAAHAWVEANAELGLSGTFAPYNPAGVTYTDSKDCVECVAEASGDFGIPPVGFSANGVAIASAGHGTLRASGRFEAWFASAGYGSFLARASAAFYDDFIISSATLGLTSGKFIVPIKFNWVATLSSAYIPGTTFTARNTFGLITRTVTERSPDYPEITANYFRQEFDSSRVTGEGGSRRVGSDLTTFLPFTFEPKIVVDFTFGQPIRLISTLEIELFAGHSNSAAISYLFGVDDAGNSAYWGGIEAVLDQNGQPVTDYTLSSASGVDWTQSSVPVPEPSRIVLMLAGWVAVCGVVSGLKRQRIAKVA
jgi:hypothetical protein